MQLGAYTTAIFPSTMMSSASPFVEHLRTNYIPSGPELNRLRSLVDDRQKLVDALNREIDELTKRRDEHARFVEEHFALLSPIRRVPNDILSLIFLASLPRNSHFPKLTTLSGVHPALVLSHVCQRWRHLSLNTPLLWSVVDIDMPRLPDPGEFRMNDAILEWEGHMQAIYEMTQLWIFRSASRPLTVSFTGGMITSYHGGNSPAGFVVTARQKMRCIVNALCDVSTRWKSLYLSITIDDDPPSARFFQMSPDTIPVLQNLSVDVDATHTSPDLFGSSLRESILIMTMGGDLVKAPSLRRLAFKRLCSSPSLLPFEWSNITELSLGTLAYRPHRSFPLSHLVLCPNLTVCSINLPAPLPLFSNTFANAATPGAQIPTSDRDICLLPRLQTLQLQGYEPPVWFAENVDLPSLRELRLLCHARGDPEVGDESGAFELIRKFGEGLTDVAIDLGSLNESKLTCVLEWLPNVVSLRLICATFSQPPEFRVLDSVLEKLTPKYVCNADGGPGDADVGGAGVCAAVLCPKLEKLGCSIIQNVGFLEDALVRLIASRRRPCNRNSSIFRSDVSRLNSVVVAFPRRRPKKTVRRTLEEMGVDLEDMVLITTYKGRSWEQAPAMLRNIHDELDFGSCSFDHEDYLSTVAPLRPMLGDWIL